MITLHLFLCLCWWHSYIFYLFDETSTVFAECFSEINYTSDLSDLWEVLFKISFCAVTKSMNWCFKSHHCWDKTDSYNKSWVSLNSYSTKKVFRHNWLSMTVYISLCHYYEVITDTENFTKSMFTKEAQHY